MSSVNYSIDHSTYHHYRNMWQIFAIETYCQHSLHCYSTNQLDFGISPLTHTGPYLLFPLVRFRYAFIRSFLPVPARGCWAGDTLRVFCWAPTSPSAPQSFLQLIRADNFLILLPVFPLEAIVRPLLLLETYCVKISLFRPHMGDEHFSWLEVFLCFFSPCLSAWEIESGVGVI